MSNKTPGEIAHDAWWKAREYAPAHCVPWGELSKKYQEHWEIAAAGVIADSAAPHLLTALKEVKEFAAKSKAHLTGDLLSERVASLVNAAIAKAEGTDALD